MGRAMRGLPVFAVVVLAAAVAAAPAQTRPLLRPSISGSERKPKLVVPKLVIPLPRPRPAEAPAAVHARTAEPPPPATAPAGPPVPSECFQRLTESFVVAKLLPDI